MYRKKFMTHLLWFSSSKCYLESDVIIKTPIIFIFYFPSIPSHTEKMKKKKDIMCMYFKCIFSQSTFTIFINAYFGFWEENEKLVWPICTWGDSMNKIMRSLPDDLEFSFYTGFCEFEKMALSIKLNFQKYYMLPN